MSVNVNPALLGLLNYAEEKGLIEACDRTYCHNRLLQMLQLDAPDEGKEALDAPLADLLGILTDSMVERGLIADGIPVRKGMKSGDVDPRGNVENCYTVSDKATAVGGGVLEAILHLSGALLED